MSRPVAHLRRGVVVSGLAVALLGGVPASAQERVHEDTHDHDASIGAVHLPVSCDVAVQADFDRAVALLHHMMYARARSAFESIAARDRGCAMAHWGVAMTLFQPLWPARPTGDDLERGWSEAERARELGAERQAERDLIAAVVAFYREPDTADWWTRIGRWAEAMEAAHRSNPDDLEVAAFYALSRLAAAQLAEDRPRQHATTAQLLLELNKREPSHPGAIHYTIHANDMQGRAGESLEVIRSYDDIAPSVPHALHMPTHIYVRLGLWPEVIEWNRKSADAALSSPVDGTTSLHYPHAADYLMYAYLQRGEDRLADDVLREVWTHQPFQEDFASAFHLAAMPARYSVERRDWSTAASLEPRNPESLAWERYPWAESLIWFARGLGAAGTDDLGAAAAAVERMAELEATATAAGEAAFTMYIAIDREVLEARIAHAYGDTEAALSNLEEAIRLEGETQKHPITPGAIYPSYEALGDLLSEIGRHDEAVEAYARSLQMWPGRYNSLLGAARAASAAGAADATREFYTRLIESTACESEREGVAEARAWLESLGC